MAPRPGRQPGPRLIHIKPLDELFHGFGRGEVGTWGSQVEVGGAYSHRRPGEDTMPADLDLLLITVFCTVDDLLPRRAGNARRMLTDAEVVTLCVAQAIMGIPSDGRFLARARKQLAHLFPVLPKRPGYLKRRQALSSTIEALIAVFARDSPGFHDDLVLVDSTPIECARSIETTRRSQLADAADYGYCASHSRYFWGFRLHGLFALDGTPRALILTSPKTPERDVCLTLLARCERNGHLTVVGNKGYAGRDFEQSARQLNATICFVTPGGGDDH